MNWPATHIIVEGPDGAGKTYLARRLCHDFQMAYHHEGPPPKDVSLLHHYGGLLANATRPTVFDRLHLGELVYGPLLRGTSGITKSDLVLMNRLVRGNGIAVVICLPEWDVCIQRTRTREEYIKDEATLRAAYTAWSQLTWGFDFCNTQVISDGETNLFTRLIYDRLPDGVIGSPNAQLLFVGEQPNSVTLDLPFFGSKQSSGYLNERLAEVGVSEDDVAITNALDLKGQVRDLAFIVAQMPELKVVVPLGRIAHEACEKLPDFVKVVPIPHPQYWKRFHAKDPAGYADRIRMAYRGCYAA